MTIYVTKAKLTADAVNRTARTIIQAVILEVGFVVIPELNRLLADEDTVWDVNVVRSIVRVAGLAGLAFIMRRYVDPSRIPTPLPPASPGSPAEPLY